MAVLTPDGFRTTTIEHELPVDKEVHEVDWDLTQIEKGGFPHFMLKEIYEQPASVRDSMRGRLNVSEGLARLGGLNMTPQEMRDIRRIIILGCGTSWHAGADRRVHARGARTHSGRGRVRLGVPLPQPDRRRGHAGARDLAVGRDRGHAGGDARGAAEGRARARHRQRRRLDHRPRIRTAASTSTPAPKSAWHRPRRSRARSRCCRC